MNNTNTFKLCIIGDGGVGKSTWIKRFLTGEFEQQYIPTLGVEVYPLRFTTNNGGVCFNAWDTAGQEKFKGLGSGYYTQADACVVMFSLTSHISFKNVASWVNRFKQVRPNAPIVLVGNKVDIKDRQVTRQEIHSFIKQNNLQYYDLSAKSNFNFEKPFVYLAREIMNAPNLNFVEFPAIQPPTINLNNLQ